jgi:hypothetical protein
MTDHLVCTYCQFVMPVDSKFCPNCGGVYQTPSPVQPAHQPAYQATPPPAYPSVPPPNDQPSLPPYQALPVPVVQAAPPPKNTKVRDRIILISVVVLSFVCLCFAVLVFSSMINT